MSKPTDSLKSSSQVKPSSPVKESSVFTLVEALESLKYLQDRKLLCNACGYNWATQENQYNLHCTSCARPGMPYNETRKGSSFEKLLATKLGDWVAQFEASGR